MSYLGHVREWYELVTRVDRDLKQPKFIAWYLRCRALLDSSGCETDT
jgi:hypothetical protein